MNRLTIGIDVGGTNIKAGLVDRTGAVRQRLSIATEAAGGFEHVFARMTVLVTDLIAVAKTERARIVGIGLGVPGPMSHAKGLIYGAPNLPGWVNIPMRDRFAAATGMPVVLENDANAAAFGEHVAGAGRGAADMVLLTLGTGIGGGVIVGGQLIRGHFDNAGEIGHLIAVPNGRACPCGQRGCLERYASANAVAQRYAEALAEQAGAAANDSAELSPDYSAVEVAERARSGEPLARAIWDETCFYLATACVTLQHLLNPLRIVLGGGMAEAGPQLFDRVREHFGKLTWHVAPDHPEIVPAQLGNDAGMIGAAALARSELGDA